MNGQVKFFARPKLKNPVLLASWPGVSNVSLNVTTYLLKKLPFKKLAEIEPLDFFEPIGVMVRNSIVEAPQFPRSEFYYWKNRRGDSDIIIFVGEDQPAAKAYDLANMVMDVAERYKVTRVYTCAAALTRMHHTEQSRVWGAASNEVVAHELRERNLWQAGALQIAGLNGLLLGIAKERKIDGICLLGEVPTYASRLPNPVAALAIVNVLTRMLGITIDTEELSQIAEEVKEKMKQAAATAMGEYIDYFTEPIWEYGEEEGEDGEGEEET
ncbi:MAG: PAC2 family protein [Chloroflexota bacterium]